MVASGRLIFVDDFFLFSPLSLQFLTAQILLVPGVLLEWKTTSSLVNSMRSSLANEALRQWGGCGILVIICTSSSWGFYSVQVVVEESTHHQFFCENSRSTVLQEFFLLQTWNFRRTFVTTAVPTRHLTSHCGLPTTTTRFLQDTFLSKSTPYPLFA